MVKILIWISIFLLLFNVCLATDITTVNDQITLWSNFGVNASVINIVNANITITNPELTQVVISQAMIPNEPNNFYYNFTPNVSGTYLMSVTFGTSDGTFYISQNTFYAQENTDMLIAIVVGLIALIIYFIYLGKDLMSKPTAVEENKGVQKWLNTQTVGLFTYMLSSWLILALIFVLERFTVGDITHSFFEVLFTTMLPVIVLANVGYWIFFVIFKINSSLKAGIRRR